ncbi:histidinol-phosphate transaminase [Shewanella sp. OPT22]|nr:histidinol-phosphate transaminase [Shewanella sp. OPT22]
MPMESSIESLLREDLADLKPYQSARRIGGKGKVFINANESPFTNVDLGDMNFETINRYPEQQPERLIEAYASYAGVNLENVVCTRGADEAIELLIRTFCNVGKDSISYFAPSYGMYQISATTCGISSIQVPFNDDYTLPSDWSNTEKSKLTFICNPNNPTGTIITPVDIKAVLNRTPFGLVVVDEAYIDFSIENTVTDLIKEFPNLVVLRTLSKAFALAGLRCGFLIASPQVTQQVLKVLAPYPVSVPVEQIATQALSSEGIALMQQQRQLIAQNKQRLLDALKGIATKVLPSASNFVYAEFDDADAIWRELVNQEIIARRYVVEKLKNGIRFTIGSTTENCTLINLFNNMKQLKDEQ